MTFAPTPEQSAIISAARDRTENLMVFALAGTGKTSTLKMAVPELPTKSVLALAFNKKNALDLEKELPPWVVCRTFNSLGHRAFASATGRRVTIDDNKVNKLVTAYSKKSGGFSDDEWGDLRNLVRKAKSMGLVPSRYPQSRKSLLSDDSFGWTSVSDTLGIDLTEQLMVGARQVLSEAIDLALSGTLDYDDQIYISTLFTGLYQKFHTVICDESQDISHLNRLQLMKSCEQRLIIAGDQKQGIYAFRGADGESMQRIRELKPDWIDLPLTVTWRCPKVVVARQLDHAPQYTAAPEAPDGELFDFTSVKEWTIGPQNGPMPSAILCRNNAPLISLAFALLRKRIGIKVLGRDFGKSLSTLIKKTAGSSTSLDAFIPAFTAWKEKEVRLALAADKESKADRITDQYESIMAVIGSLETPTTTELLFAIEQLFDSNSGQITLSSGHKAKGLEWHTVLHLDPWRIPSKWAATNPIALEQEMNLKYVIETRAKHTLILANLEQFV
jgi:superfamily I DNA/RNA helicase